jgi:hypothetical protein
MYGIEFSTNSDFISDREEKLEDVTRLSDELYKLSSHLNPNVG